MAFSLILQGFACWTPQPLGCGRIPKLRDSDVRQLAKLPAAGRSLVLRGGVLRPPSQIGNLRHEDPNSCEFGYTRYEQFLT